MMDSAVLLQPDSQENAMNYDKGVLAEILEPIMGKGLIPADLETWKVKFMCHWYCEVYTAGEGNQPLHAWPCS